MRKPDCSDKSDSSLQPLLSRCRLGLASLHFRRSPDNMPAVCHQHRTPLAPAWPYRLLCGRLSLAMAPSICWQPRWRARRAQNSPKLAWVAPPGFARFDIPLKHVAERISAGQPVTIVAIGSSSTFGAGASSDVMTYPSQLAVELRALLPHTSITVINRG